MIDDTTGGHPPVSEGPAPADVRLRRLVRGWGLVFLVAVGFLFMAMCIREQPRTVPAQGMRAHTTVAR